MYIKIWSVENLSIEEVASVVSPHLLYLCVYIYTYTYMNIYTNMECQKSVDLVGSKRREPSSVEYVYIYVHIYLYKCILKYEVSKICPLSRGQVSTHLLYVCVYISNHINTYANMRFRKSVYTVIG